MTLLVVEHVTKRFGGLVAVDDVSFQVERGELLAIAGPNGAGKTTLFNLISGVGMPDSGRIVFDDVNLTFLPPYRRAHLGLGRTFQIARPFGSASVRENVAIGAMFGSMAADINVDQSLEIADHYLQRLQLADHRHKLADRLTPMEKKRMELARALAMKPRLLLMDEALAGMNPHEVDKMVDLLLSIREEENTAIVGLVEHIMRVVVGLTRRVIVMHQGRVFLDAPTQTALSDPGVIEIYLGTPAERTDAAS
jgi:branched-chain amino acid transport system ATP-binding protein